MQIGTHMWHSTVSHYCLVPKHSQNTTLNVKQLGVKMFPNLHIEIDTQRQSVITQRYTRYQQLHFVFFRRLGLVWYSFLNALVKIVLNMETRTNLPNCSYYKVFRSHKTSKNNQVQNNHPNHTNQMSHKHQSDSSQQPNFTL